VEAQAAQAQSAARGGEQLTSRADTPLVTIVMSAWKPNREWLIEAVQSVLAQRGCRFELLVIDDGSPQPVAELLEGIDDPRMRIERVEHGGLSRARNAGASLARGDYIRFVDCDDFYPPDSTAHLLELTGGADDVVTYGATLMCDEQLRPVWKMVSRVEGNFTVPSLLGRFHIRPHVLLFPRRVVEATGEFDPSYRVTEDWDYVLRASEHARARGDSHVATHYRRHGSAMTADTASGEEAARRIVTEYFERHPELKGSRLERLAEARLMATSGRVRATHGDPREGARRLWKALKLDPRAVGYEVAQMLQAIWGHLRHGQVRRMISALRPRRG
jgi:glycosyltransferase involved in cell wall biosynthesis